MDEKLLNDSLFQFLQSSPSSFHAVAAMAGRFERAGFMQIREDEYWSLVQGSSYFLVREDSGLVAFTLGKNEKRENGFRMLATHSDSPGLQIKPRAEKTAGTYLQLGVEVYGGPLLGPWFDRDLSLAGRVCCQLTDGSLRILLVDFARPLLIIPSLAVHFDRSANENKSINAQNHLAPIIAQSIDGQLPQFPNVLREQLTRQYPGIEITQILGFDLFCYDTLKPTFLGLDNEFISSARLDNLLSCHIAATALTQAGNDRNALFFCANHEENGSVSSTGARGSFLESVLERLLPEAQARRISLARSFLLSIDNAHALHPNYRDTAEPQHEIVMNRGPVIKTNANQRYATSGLSAAAFKLLAAEADIAVQEFVMRSDMPCGSTIGPLTAARLGIRTVDIGAPTLSMHSIRELTGCRDPYLLYRSVHQFLTTANDVLTGK
jgi:aspartyl aminopeptidase